MPPPKPAPLHATIAGVDVHGALPAAEVQRAVQRTLATLDRCNPTEAQSLVVHFRIGESRRAEDVRAIGGVATTNGCVAAALRALRVESAPDVGDVEVTVRVAYAVGT